MARRLVLSYICDECGEIQTKEIMSSAFGQNIVTDLLNWYPPNGWHQRRMEGSKFSFVDYCPKCKEKK